MPVALGGARLVAAARAADFRALPVSPGSYRYVKLLIERHKVAGGQRRTTV
jgi:hypothetical protein